MKFIDLEKYFERHFKRMKFFKKKIIKSLKGDTINNNIDFIRKKYTFY